jgi:glycosyltransferase domain-containing protein
MADPSELTLVVPTYNRQIDALRQMHFWSGTPVKIHVLDGTITPIDAERLKGLGKNVHYYHLPYSIEERLRKSLELVDTPYVAMLCDDEFFIPSALKHCIDELKTHKDFVACIGRCLGFYSKNKGIMAAPAYNIWKGYRCVGATTGERMIEHMNPYVCSTIYAVQRSEVWKKSMAILAKEKFSSPYVGELQFELATCYQGKSMVIEELMWLRNCENKPIDFNKWNIKLRFDAWIKDPSYGAEVKLFYDNTANELAKIDGADKEKVLADFKLAVDAYLNFCNNRRVLFPVAKLRDQLMQLSLEKLRRKIQSSGVDYGWQPIMEEAQNTQKDGVTVDMKQLKEIVEFMGKKMYEKYK